MNDRQKQHEDFDLELKLDSAAVDLSYMLSVGGDLSALLAEVGRTFTDRSKSPVRWMVEVAEGSVRLPLRGEPVSENVQGHAAHAIAETVVTGVGQLEHEAQLPDGFSLHAVALARRLAKRAAGNEVPVSLRNGGAPVVLTDRIVANATEVLGPSIRTFGSVEGTLEAVNVHERNRFSVYDALTGRAVECAFGKHVGLDRVTSLVGERVIATGTVKSSRDGEAESVEVHELDPIPSPVSADRVLGIFKGFREVDA